MPEGMRAEFDEIVALSDKFCKQHLDDEYASLALGMAATLAHEHPGVLGNPQPNSWATGILYVLGQVNFLFDSGHSPHLQAEELCEQMGVLRETASEYAREIRNLLAIKPMDPRWTLPGPIDDDPFTWAVIADGNMEDVRSLPREVQMWAYHKGLIPYIPTDREDE